jgi:glutamyl-tRNA reductase
MASVDEPSPDPDTDDETGNADSGRDVEEAVARLRARGARTADRECEEALARLRAQGTLSDAQKRAVERLAERLAGRLLAVPERELRVADDEERVRVALELFGE